MKKKKKVSIAEMFKNHPKQKRKVEPEVKFTEEQLRILYHREEMKKNNTGDE